MAHTKNCIWHSSPGICSCGAKTAPVSNSSLIDGLCATDIEKATKIVDWVSKQKYGGEPILHAAVCCDFSGRAHFIKEIAKLLGT